MQQTSNNGDSKSNAPGGESVDALAELVDRWLREQPLRRAPDSLQTRVMAAIEHRERRSWQQGFHRWPLVARVAFIALSAGVAKLAVDGSMLLLSSMGTFSVPRLPLATALLEAVLAVSRHLPQLWLYGGLALSILVYGGLFGISTAVYRTLYIPR